MLPLDKASLRARIAAGETFTFRPFYGHVVEDPLGDGVFSQWYPASFVVDGVTYATAEHWMMAEKARIFGDAEARAAILATPSPAAAKKLGRTVRGFDDAVWRRHRFEVVVAGNRHKFAEPRRGAYLRATGDAILVEAAPRDLVWGVGLGVSNPAVHDPAKWRGTNLLGFALVAARAALA